MKKVFLEILQHSQESTCARASFLIKLQTLGQGTPLVAASAVLESLFKKVVKKIFLGKMFWLTQMTLRVT